MINYPVWWDTTVTIYNRYENNVTQYVKWYRTVIEGCFWKNIRNELKVGEVTISTANNILCRIRQNEKFMQAYEWNQIPTDSKGDYFTIAQGDIIVCGIVEDEIDEYMKWHRSTDLISKYKAMGCMEVETIAINVGAGRVNPHYRVEGR